MVLDAAQEIFAEGGFADAAMTAIAARASVSKAVLYDCFPGGKQEIYYALVERNEQQLMDHVLEMLTQTNRLPLEDALTGALRGFISYAKDHPLAFRMIFGDAGSSDPDIAARAQRTKDLMLQKMGERTKQIMEIGGMTMGPYAGVYNRMFVAILEEMARWALHEDDLPTEKLIAAVVDWLMRGFESFLPGDAWAKPAPD